MFALGLLLANDVGHPRRGDEAEGDEGVERDVERVDPGVDLVLVLGPLMGNSTVI